MTTTTNQRQDIKAKAESVADRYRITAGGEVHFYGVMPNTNQTGWYLYAQSEDEAAEMIRRESTATERTPNDLF